MAKVIKTRTPLQCRSHHQKMGHRPVDSKMNVTMSKKESPDLGLITKDVDAKNCSLVEDHMAKLNLPTLLRTDINLLAMQA